MGGFQYNVIKKHTGNGQRLKGMEEEWTGSQGLELPIDFEKKCA
jgi:hypothetical protein